MCSDCCDFQFQQLCWFSAYETAWAAFNGNPISNLLQQIELLQAAPKNSAVSNFLSAPTLWLNIDFEILCKPRMKQLEGYHFDFKFKENLLFSCCWLCSLIKTNNWSSCTVPKVTWLNQWQVENRFPVERFNSIILQGGSSGTVFPQKWQNFL